MAGILGQSTSSDYRSPIKFPEEPNYLRRRPSKRLLANFGLQATRSAREADGTLGWSLNCPWR
jgi:hypothetical protein